MSSPSRDNEGFDTLHEASRPRFVEAVLPSLRKQFSTKFASRLRVVGARDPEGVRGRASLEEDDHVLAPGLLRPVSHVERAVTLGGGIRRRTGTPSSRFGIVKQAAGCHSL